MKRVVGRYREKRRGTRLLLAVIMLCVLTGGVYWGLREVAIRIADHLTVTVTHNAADPGAPAGSTVYQHTFGRALAAEAEHLLNDETIIVTVFTPLRADGGTPDEGAGWHYHLAFTWQGILVETMDITCISLPEQYHVSALGVEAPWQVWSSRNISVVDQLVQASGGSIPPTNATTWPPTVSTGS